METMIRSLYFGVLKTLCFPVTWPVTNLVSPNFNAIAVSIVAAPVYSRGGSSSDLPRPFIIFEVSLPVTDYRFVNKYHSTPNGEQRRFVLKR